MPVDQAEELVALGGDSQTTVRLPAVDPPLDTLPVRFAVTDDGVFIAAATDNLIRAIDVETGETVWTDVLPGGGQANVMTYSQDGRQYVVVMAGGHHFMKTPVSDAIVAYALPWN